MSDTSFGYGHEIPNDSGDLHNTIAFVCRQVMALEMWTTCVVKVVAVNGGGVAPAGTVDVQPLVSQIDGNAYGTPHGVVPGLPWSRIQGGKSAVICDPVVGDIGYVVAADRDISKVKSTMAAALPGSRRRFDIADGIYAGGALNQEPTCYLWFTTDGHFKFVDIDGNVIESSATGIALTPKGGQPVTVNGSLVVTQNFQLGGSLQSQAGGLYGGDLHTAGTVTGDTDVVAGTISGKSHKHETLGGSGTNTSTPL